MARGKSLHFVESGKVNQSSHEIAPLLTHMLRGVTKLMTYAVSVTKLTVSLEM